jgi:hypothetical protein
MKSEKYCEKKNQNRKEEEDAKLLKYISYFRIFVV